MVETSTESAPARRETLFSAHLFQFFNAVSFQIIMGAPIILYAKSIGASSTVLGIIAAFTPLMMVFQLPAAKHLHRFGYRQFVLMGWGARCIFIFVVAVIPLLSFLDNTSKMAVLIATLFVFNLLRGISTAAWLPWITAIVPEHQRGRFISTDQIFMYGGSLVSLLISALVMTGQVDPWEYSVVFLLSAVGGSVSLIFIRRIPEAVIDESASKISQKVPWRAMLAYLPFRELIVFNLLATIVIGSLGVFTVEFLRDTSHFEVSAVLYLTTASFVGAGLILPFAGTIVEQTGSKPLLRIAFLLFGLVIGVWMLCAASVIPTTFLLICTLNFITGIASANYSLANLRITMSTMPEMGRNHFFALYSVITSLSLGASPIAWGLMLDVLGTYEVVTGAFHWKRHSLYFLALLLINVFAFAYIRRLHEAAGSGRLEPSLIYARLKRLPRFWHR